MSNKLKTENKKLETAQGGFTIFLAVLISSLALAVGVAIYDLTIRELDLTIASRESQYAVYAADTGTECALYWYYKNFGNTITAFATSSTSALPASGTLVCNNQDIMAASGPLNLGWGVAPATTPTAATTTTWFSMGGPSGAIANPCVEVVVAINGPKTKIVSNGFNNCINNAPNRLERTIQVNF